MGDKENAEKELQEEKDKLVIDEVVAQNPEGAKGLLIIVLIVVICALCVVGGIVYYFCCRDKSSDNEGGEYEADDLFKRVFEGKANEEAMNPTAAEEKI